MKYSIRISIYLLALIDNYMSVKAPSALQLVMNLCLQCYSHELTRMHVRLGVTQDLCGTALYT
jgi:hypothetical protein